MSREVYLAALVSNKDQVLLAHSGNGQMMLPCGVFRHDQGGDEQVVRIVSDTTGHDVVLQAMVDAVDGPDGSVVLIASCALAAGADTQAKRGVWFGRWNPKRQLGHLAFESVRHLREQQRDADPEPTVGRVYTLEGRLRADANVTFSLTTNDGDLASRVRSMVSAYGDRDFRLLEDGEDITDRPIYPTPAAGDTGVFGGR